MVSLTTSWFPSVETRCTYSASLRSSRVTHPPYSVPDDSRQAHSRWRAKSHPAPGRNVGSSSRAAICTTTHSTKGYRPHFPCWCLSSVCAHVKGDSIRPNALSCYNTPAQRAVSSRKMAATCFISLRPSLPTRSRLLIKSPLRNGLRPSRELELERKSSESKMVQQCSSESFICEAQGVFIIKLWCVCVCRATYWFERSPSALTII